MKFVGFNTIFIYFMIYLGLDIGQKRIGLAISESGILAREYRTIEYSDRQSAIEQILAICRKEKVEKIVLGLPKLKNGRESFQTKCVRDFKQALRKQTRLPIVFVDEYLTSKESERLLKLTDPKITKNRRAMRQKVDQISARLILEDYLNRFF